MVVSFVLNVGLQFGTSGRRIGSNCRSPSTSLKTGEVLCRAQVVNRRELKQFQWTLIQTLEIEFLVGAGFGAPTHQQNCIRSSCRMIMLTSTHTNLPRMAALASSNPHPTGSL